MIDRNAPIGVFDSGVGGLTVMKEIMHQIPSEKVVYFGDTARVPYGNKSKETVTKFSRQIVHFLHTAYLFWRKSISLLLLRTCLAKTAGKKMRL